MSISKQMFFFPSTLYQYIVILAKILK